MGKEVKCDRCKEAFEVAEGDFRNRQSGDVLFRYFKCPHCEAAFLVSAYDRKFLKFLRKYSLGKLRVSSEDLQKMSMEETARHIDRFRELVPEAYLDSSHATAHSAGATSPGASFGCQPGAAADPLRVGGGA